MVEGRAKPQGSRAEIKATTIIKEAAALIFIFVLHRIVYYLKTKHISLKAYGKLKLQSNVYQETK